MKTKLEMAHDYLRDIVSNWEYDDSFDPVAEAWQYADAMQAEADKREKEEVDKQSVELRNILNLSKFKPLELQPARMTGNPIGVKRLIGLTGGLWMEIKRQDGFIQN